MTRLGQRVYSDSLKPMKDRTVKELTALIAGGGE